MTAAPTGEAVVADLPDGMFSKPPTFEGGGGGLVSTADDYLAFASALLARRHPPRAAGPLAALHHPHDHRPADPGAEGDVRILAGVFRQSGLGIRDVGRHPANPPGPSVGSYGWSGFYGTSWYNDPAEDMTAIVIMQRAHMGDQTLPMWNDFWTTAYQAIDD